MYDGEGELALCEILTKALVLCILLEGERGGVDMKCTKETPSHFPSQGSANLPLRTEGCNSHHGSGSTVQDSPEVGRSC